jgi:hypothetical protein
MPGLGPVDGVFARFRGQGEGEVRIGPERYGGDGAVGITAEPTATRGGQPQASGTVRST